MKNEVRSVWIYSRFVFNKIIMAKELPYFKFEPNQWENGNIQIFNHTEKGVFIDLCSMYWSRLGDVSYKLAVQKICAGNATALDSLYENKIIDIIDGNIFINFLSEQLNEFEDTSKTNSKNALLGWEKRRKQKEESERNATALDSQCESDAIREDKIKKNNHLLSEIDISDVDENLKVYFSIAKEFQLLFIKNLTDKGASTVNQQKAKFKNYVNPIRLMIENKECTIENLREVFKYLNSTRGEFWKSNILSTETLRKQINKLIMEANKKEIVKPKTDRL